MLAALRLRLPLAVNGYGAVFLKKLLDVCAKLIVQYIDIDAARYMAFGIFGYRAYINQLDGLVLYHFLKLVGGKILEFVTVFAGTCP